MKIGFIGLGNMAKAIIGGILAKDILEADDICGSAPSQKTREHITAKFGIATYDNNLSVARDSDIIVLAVKPQFLKVVIAEIMEAVDDKKIIISIAAGKSISWICKEFEKDVKIVRVMPNTPALVGEGCSAVCRNDLVTDEDMSFVMSLLQSFGKAYNIPENLMDVAGAVSGASPAYVFMFIEAMADGAVAGGMPRKQAYEFAAQAVLGAAKMVLETKKHPGELKDMVCSPAGTTIEGLRRLEEGSFRGTVMDAMTAVVEKSRKL